MTINAPMDGAVLQSLTEQIPVPSLRRGDVLAVDNLGPTNAGKSPPRLPEPDPKRNIRPSIRQI